MTDRRRRRASEGGFTLIELMAVVVIIVILAAIAVPAMNRYSNETEFTDVVRRLAGSLQMARYHSQSRPEDGVLLIEKHQAKQMDRYSVQAVLPGTSTMTQLKQEQVPSYVQIYGVTDETAVPGISYTVPTSRGQGMPCEIRFTGTGNVQVLLGKFSTKDSAALNELENNDSSATIFLQSDDKKHRSRIVLYMTTGYTRTLEGW